MAIDFPSGFTEQAAQRLMTIATNGPRCGVYVLATVDRTSAAAEYVRSFKLADLARGATIVAYESDHFVLSEKELRSARLDLDTPPPAAQFESIVKRVGKVAKANSVVRYDFDTVAVSAQNRWRETTDEEVVVPIGVSGAGTVLELCLGQGTAHHALIAGRTGSGKSVLMHALIVNLALKYSPEEAQIYLIDFKQGVEFKDYADYALPHARVVAIESEREFGLSVLQGLDAELQRRAEAFRSAGAQNLAAYRNKLHAQQKRHDCPRVVLIVDEFQEFFVEGDAASAQAALILDRLVRQGRSFGIHVIMASQTLAGAYSLARSTMDQMYVRIALQCSDADSRLILAEDNPTARLLTRPGEAIYNSAGGSAETGNQTRFQVAWIDEKIRRRFLGEIAECAKKVGRAFPPPIIFEGNQPANLVANMELDRSFSTPQNLQVLPKSVKLWLGEPIAIKLPTAAIFSRRAGRNLIIVSRDEKSAVGMMAASVVSLAVQHDPGQLRLLIVDLTTADSEWSAVFPSFAEMLPHSVTVGRQRSVPELVREAADLVASRVQSEQLNGPRVVIMIAGLQRARDLRQEEVSYYATRDEPESVSPAQLLGRVLSEGPEVDVHVIAWCDSYGNLTRMLDRRGLTEFGLRLAETMSMEDSSAFLGEPVAAKFGPYRAVLHDEESVGRYEKFRPYSSIPDRAWFQHVGGRLRDRWQRASEQ